MTPLVTTLMVGLFLCLVYACYLLRKIHVTLISLNATQVATRDEIRELRLTSRARVSQASFGKAANDPGVTLVRSGRAASSRRVIAGGDESSAQYQELQDRLGGDDVSNVGRQ